MRQLSAAHRCESHLDIVDEFGFSGRPELDSFVAAVIFKIMNTSDALAEAVHEADGAGDVSRLFLALANPTRLRILNLLAAGWLCVCDLVELLQEPQPTISRYLGTLREDGLIEVRREGRFAYYRLAEPTDELRSTLLRCVRRILLQSPDLARDRQAAERCADERRATPCLK